MPQLNFPAPGATNAVQHLTSFGVFDIAPTYTYRYTNLFSWSEDLTQNTWIRQTGNTIFTADFDNINHYIYDNEPISPTGLTVFRNNDNSFNITVSANSTSFGQRITVLPNTTYTLSFYAKSGTAGNVFYRVVDNTISANIIQSTNYAANITANTFTRINATFTTGPVCTSATLFLIDNTIGSDFGSVNVYWPQIESGSSATDYNSTQTVSYASLGLSLLSPNNVTVSGSLTDYVDLNYDFAPIIYILGVNTVTYNTSVYYTDDLDLFTTNIQSSSTKILYIPEQPLPPFSTGENIRLTDSASGITKLYTVANCTSRTITINTDDFISEKLVVLARTFSPVYSQDKIINDARLRPFAGNASSPRDNYYISTYFGIPYRAQQILGTDKVNFSLVDSRPRDNNFTRPLTQSFVTFATRNQISVRGFNEARIFSGTIRNSFPVRGTRALGDLTIGTFRGSSVYPLREANPSRNLLQVFLNRDKTLPLKPDISWITTNPMGFSVRAIFKQEREVFDRSLITRAVVNLETKLRAHPVNLSLLSRIEASKFTRLVATQESFLAPLPKINVILPRFFRAPVDRRELSFILSTRVVSKVHDVNVQQALPTLGQINKDSFKLLPADRINRFHKTDSFTYRLKPEYFVGLSTEALLDNINYLEKRLITNFITLSVELLRDNVDRIESNTVTVTRNNISNVTTLTSKTGYTPAERYLIDILKPIYRTQFVNTNSGLDVASLNLEANLRTRAVVIPVVRSNVYAALDSNFKVNTLQKRIFSLRTDSIVSLRNTARLGRLAMANVTMAISSHIEKDYYKVIPLRTIPRVVGLTSDFRLARVNRAFINYKFSNFDGNQLKPALAIPRIRVGTTTDNLRSTATLTLFRNYLIPAKYWFVVNDTPLKQSFGGLRKYINEGIAQPPMKVIGQSNLGDNAAEAYIDDGDIFRTGLKFTPIVSPSTVTANDIVPFRILGGPTAAVNAGNNVTVTVRKKADTADFYAPGYTAETWIDIGNVTLDANGSFIDSSVTWSNIGVATFEVTFPYGSYVVAGANIYQNRLTQSITVTSLTSQTQELSLPTTQTITVDPVVRVESPAVYFDGYQDFIESTSTAMLGLGSTPVTIEMMIRPMASSPLQVITSFWSNNFNNFTDKIDIYLNSQLQVCLGRVYPISLDFFSPVKGAYEQILLCRTNNSLTTSAITHLAVVVQNNSVNIYFNGVQQTIVGSNAVMLPIGNAQFRIGYAGAPVPTFTQFTGNV